MHSFSIRKQILISLGLIGAIFYSGVNIIGVSLVPVVMFMEASEVENKGHYLTARIHGIKVRNCSYLRERGYVKLTDSDYWSEEGYFYYVEDKSPNSSKPHGKHDFGYWRWDAYGDSKISEVKLVTEHDCNGRRVFTTVGPFS